MKKNNQTLLALVLGAAAANLAAALWAAGKKRGSSLGEVILAGIRAKEAEEESAGREPGEE